MVNHPFLTWTNDASALPSSVYSPRRHRRRGYVRALLLALLPSLSTWLN